MVRKALSLLFVLSLVFPLIAGVEVGGELDLMGMYFDGSLDPSKLNGSFSSLSYDSLLLSESAIYDKAMAIYSAAGNVSVNASFSGVKAEAKGSYAFYSMDGSSGSEFSIDKANIRFRIPSFGGKKITITAGKAPISWGLGYYYRVGDVLFDSSMHNKEAGTSDSRNIWLLEASQSLGGGFAGDIAFSIPLESQKARIGATLRKSFSNKYFKGIYGYYSYSEGNIHKAALALDMNLYFDITAGVESQFRSEKDARGVINLMHQYSFETEMNTYSLGLYLSSELDFYEDAYNILFALSFAPTSRTTIALSATNEFTSKDYKGILANLSIEFLVLDGVKLESGMIYSYNKLLAKNSYAGFVGLESSF